MPEAKRKGKLKKTKAKLKDTDPKDTEQSTAEDFVHMAEVAPRKTEAYSERTKQDRDPSDDAGSSLVMAMPIARAKRRLSMSF